MRLSEVFTARAVAEQYTEAAENRIPYLGEGLFPAKKKLGLDLRTIRTHKGLPVSLAPSNFDAKSTLRSREGIKIDQTEMAFFRESMLVKEADEQEIMRVQDANDPYAQDVLSRVYDDANTLVEGAEVVAERMRMQLLAPVDDGSPRINIAANGTQYSYNYDPDGDYKTNHVLTLTGTDKWIDHANADPLRDLQKAKDDVLAASGAQVKYLLVSPKTMRQLKQNKKLRSYILAQNSTANIYMTDARVKEAIDSEVGLTVIVYSKKFRDEKGNVQSYFPDGIATLIPEGALGSTWFGTTPEERTLMGSNQANVALVGTGIAVAVSTTEDPVNTKTTVSEIVLPSFERMDETFVIKAFDAEDAEVPEANA